jgi:hypothetical protein
VSGLCLLASLSSGGDGAAFGMVQGHVPTGPLLSESIGQGLVVWVNRVVKVHGTECCSAPLKSIAMVSNIM